MLLYHASNSNYPINNPDVNHSNSSTDCGPGFYLTDDFDVATRFSARKRGLINEYEVDDGIFTGYRYNVLTFDDYSYEWLDMVIDCRSGDDIYYNNYDIIVAPIADDKVAATVADCYSGIISDEEAIERLKGRELYWQYVFKSRNALSELHYLNAY